MPGSLFLTWYHNKSFLSAKSNDKDLEGDTRKVASKTRYSSLKRNESPKLKETTEIQEERVL
jgi:hypothetical protein